MTKGSPTPRPCGGAGQGPSGGRAHPPRSLSLLALLVAVGGWGCAGSTAGVVSTAPAAADPHGAGHGNPSAGPSGPSETVPLYDDLGDLSRRVGTRVPEAQLYFDQGLRLTYGFGHPEAIRAFQEAQRLDPECAMCFWGEAWARGPYINARMDSVGGVAALAAIRRAQQLAARDPSRVNPVEQDLIDAMAKRYVTVPTSQNRAGLDSVYADAMREVFQAHPEDLDVGTLFAESLMVLRPWDHWTREGRPQPGTDEVLSTLEAVLALDLTHPGSCHLYVHATEASPDPGRAEACADHLGDQIPGASHIPHMPSHTYVQIGRWGDAVRANQRAWHADQRAYYGSAPGIYPTHNLHMLLYAAAYDGQSAVAAQAARDLARLSAGSAFYVDVIMARFGRWDELLDRTAHGPTATVQWQRGVNHMGRGLAHLKALEGGTPDSASVYLDRLRAVRDSLPEGAAFRGHPQRGLLDIAGAILEGEIHAAAGRYPQAIQVLEAALPIEDGLDYDEPEPWPFPVRHVLGAILLEAGLPDAAEVRYREDLRHHPGNGWALFGLERALGQLGLPVEAERTGEEFAAAWSRADVWLRSSRF